MTLYKSKLQKRKSNQNVFNVNKEGLSRKFITKKKLNVICTRVAPLKREKGLKFNVVSEEVDETGVKTLGCEYIGVSQSPTSSEHPLFNEKSTSVNKTSCSKISLLEPIFVNPASKSSLKVVLDKIAPDAGINSGYRRFVCCLRWFLNDTGLAANPRGSTKLFLGYSYNGSGTRGDEHGEIIH